MRDRVKRIPGLETQSSQPLLLLMLVWSFFRDRVQRSTLQCHYGSSLLWLRFLHSGLGKSAGYRGIREPLAGYRGTRRKVLAFSLVFQRTLFQAAQQRPHFAPNNT